MSRDPRFDILFEPVQIGPVVARNRFYQVPHCNGMGYRDPTALAAMRGIKAEGGWAVVCTEQVEIHYSSEITPFIELRLWDDRDMPGLVRMSDAVHAHGALAGIELCYNGMNGSNLYSREIPMGPAHLPVATFTYDPVQARAMSKRDIASLRRWHRAAAVRAKRADFDIIYVYAGHALGGLHHFLSRRYNDRTDEYGGSLENRVRLLREVIEDTRDAVGDRSAVAVRVTVDELLGDEGLSKAEMEDAFGLLGELPDLWDLVLGSWEDDSRTSRFADEAFQEPFVTGFKRLTTKPVVGVGRFTSPDTMVRQVRAGILDLIGCARPSIADPFLPKKVEEGRVEDIRECIGCNICVSGDFTMSPIRCTQNPSMGEEWRRGWHPERIRRKTSEANVLVVGGGPAGLEAAMMLGRRGCDVALADTGESLGGRVSREARLPGLSAWARVRDYRTYQIARMPTVQTYLASPLTAEDVLGFGFAHVAVATGSTWRRDGVGTAAHEADPARRVRGCAHAGRPDGGEAASGSRGRGVRRRPLLHGLRARRVAHRRWVLRATRDDGVACRGLDVPHDGAAPHPVAPARTGRDRRSKSRCACDGAGRRRAGLQVHRSHGDRRVRCPGSGDGAAARRQPVHGPHGTAVRLARRRHRPRAGDR